MRKWLFNFRTVEVFSADQSWSCDRLDNNRWSIPFFCVCCLVIGFNVANAGDAWESKSKSDLRLGLDKEMIEVSNRRYQSRDRKNTKEELIRFREGWAKFVDMTRGDWAFFEKPTGTIQKSASRTAPKYKKEMLSTGKYRNQIGELEYIFLRLESSTKKSSCVYMRQFFDCIHWRCNDSSSPRLGAALGTSGIFSLYCPAGGQRTIELRTAQRFFDAIYLKPKWTTGLRGKYPQTAHVKKEPKTTTVTPSSSNATDQSSLELEFWQTIKKSDDPDMYREYLRLFPEGVFSGLAKLKIKKLGGTLLK